MDLHDYWQALRRSWIVVVVLVILGGAAGFGIGRGVTPTYEATSSVFVSAALGSTTDQLAQGSTFTQNTVASYATLATTPAVLSPVISTLGLDTTVSKLASRVSAQTPLNTVLVKITVSDSSARQAADIANAVSLSLRSEATQLAPKLANGDSAITMSIVAPAQEPASPVKPNKRLLEAAGAGIGLILGIVFALLRFVGDPRVRHENDYSRQTGRALLGTVRRTPRMPTGEFLVANRPEIAATEDFRRLAATLQFVVDGSSARSITVTSVESGGTSADFSVNLGLAVGERGLSVLVVDGNLRQSGIAELAGVDGRPGLSDVLAGSKSIESAVQALSETVDLLPSGDLLSNPSPALRENAVARFVETIRDAYDVVVIDSPSVIDQADALGFAVATDSTILVARLGATTRSELDRAVLLTSGVHAENVELVVMGSTPRVGARQKAPAEAKPAPPTPAPISTGAQAADDEKTHDLANR